MIKEKDLTDKEVKVLRKLIRQYPLTPDQCYPPAPDRIDQPKINAEIDDSVYIEYYAHGKPLGNAMIKKGSNQKDRETLAKDIGIEFFDMFELDQGRVVASISDLGGFLDEHGRFWVVSNNS